MNTLNHVAIIMDGNGRWAQERGLSRSHGHKAGSEAVRKIITYGRKMNLPYLTLYALSRENMNRPKEELSQLFQLLTQFIKEEVPNLMKEDIQLHVIGDISSLPFASQKALEYALNKTKNGKSMHLALALAYSAREEVARAILRIQKKNDISSYTAQELSNKILDHLDAPSFPEPDLIIRTGNDKRLSNFLLYQAAYSELYFSELYFPDFNEKELEMAFEDYRQRKRRFGKTTEQVSF